MNTSNSSLRTRLIAAIVSVGVTVALFSAVISPAMQSQTDGSIRLAHSTVSAPCAPAPVLVAHADSDQ